MATVNTNNTGSIQPEGWGEGNDGNTYAQAQSIATPWALWKMSDDEPLIQSGDISVLFGTEATPTLFNEDELHYNDSLTFRALEPLMVTLMGSSTTGNAVITNNQNDMTYDGLIIDAEGKDTTVYTAGVNGGGNITIGGILKGWNLYGSYSEGFVDIDGTEISTTSDKNSTGVSGFRVIGEVAGKNSVARGDWSVTIDHTLTTGAGQAITAFRIAPNPNTIGFDATITGGMIDITVANPDALITHGSLGENSGKSIENAIIRDTVAVSRGPATGVNGFIISSDSTVGLVTALAEITGVSVIHEGSVPIDGVALQIGNNINSFPAGTALVTLAIMERNFVRNFDHGPFFGGLLNQTARRNRVEDSNLSLTLKGCDGCKHTSSLVTNPRAVAARFKSSDNCQINNATIYVDVDRGAISSGLFQAMNDGETASSGNRFTNNSVHIALGGKVNRVIDVNPDSAGQWTASNNNYFFEGGSIDDACSIAFAVIDGVQYDFETYKSTFEPTATSIDTKLVNAPLNLRPTVTLLGLSGSATGEVDFDGSLFETPRPQVGAFNFFNPLSPTLDTPYEVIVLDKSTSGSIDLGTNWGGAGLFTITQLPPWMSQVGSTGVVNFTDVVWGGGNSDNTVGSGVWSIHIQVFDPTGTVFSTAQILTYVRR